jgi:hypothetical protein
MRLLRQKQETDATQAKVTVSGTNANWVPPKQQQQFVPPQQQQPVTSWSININWSVEVVEPGPGNNCWLPAMAKSCVVEPNERSGKLRCKFVSIILDTGKDMVVPAEQESIRLLRCHGDMGADLFRDEQRRLEMVPVQNKPNPSSGGGGDDNLADKWERIQAAGQRRQEGEGQQKSKKFTDEFDPAAEQRRRMGLDEMDDDEYMPWDEKPGENGGGTGGGREEGEGGGHDMAAVQRALKSGMSKGPMAVQMSYRRKYVNKPGDYRISHRKRVHAMMRREVEWKKKVHVEMLGKKREKAAEEYQKSRWKELEAASAKMKRQRDESVKKDERGREKKLHQSREATAERRAKEKATAALERARVVKATQQETAAQKEAARQTRTEEREAKEKEAARVRAEKKAKAEELRLRREANIRRKEEERDRVLVERARALQMQEVPSACKAAWLPPPPLPVDEQQANSGGGSGGVQINRRRSSASPPLQTLASSGGARGSSKGSKGSSTQPRGASASSSARGGGEVQVVLFEGEVKLPDVREVTEEEKSAMEGEIDGVAGRTTHSARMRPSTSTTHRCCMVRVLEVRADENSGSNGHSGSSWVDAGTRSERERAAPTTGKAVWLRVMARPLSMLRRERLAAVRSDHGSFSSLMAVDVPLDDSFWGRLSDTRHAGGTVTHSAAGGDKLVKQAQKLIASRPGASISATLSEDQSQRLVEALVEEIGVRTGSDAREPRGLCLLPMAEDRRRVYRIC